MNALAITQRDGSPGTLAVSDIDKFAKRLRGLFRHAAKAGTAA
ncbi:MAG: hypothetical protein Q7J84_01135 [Sulfuricaulis sp.]|nr:hypothetical protein [Sulfuricaulis sp.]